MKENLKEKYAKTVFISSIVLAAIGPLYTLVSMFFYIFTNLNFFDVRFTEAKLVGTILLAAIFVVELLFVIPGFTCVINGKHLKAAKIIGYIRGTITVISVVILLIAIFNQQSLSDSAYSIKYFISLFAHVFYVYGIIMYKPNAIAEQNN